jgi:hypothetical protein
MASDGRQELACALLALQEATTGDCVTARAWSDDAQGQA